MSTNAKAVDVLAVMERDASCAKAYRARHRDPNLETRFLESERARAAVAALIRAVKSERKARDRWQADGRIISDAAAALCRAEDRVAAALARIGGTP